MARSAVARSTKPSAQEFILNTYGKVLDEIEKDHDLTAGDSSQYRLSTGILMVDWISGGGLVAGMTTVAGPEMSGKSTLTMTAMHSAIKSKVPLIEHFDAEGTAQSDPGYIANILRVKSLDQVYGKRVGGVWQIPPRVRYWDTGVLEKYFNSLVQTLNSIPDKIYNREANQWFLRIALHGKNGKRQARFLDFGERDKKLSDREYAWIPTDNPYPQALIIPDSYVTFLSEKADEEEEMGGGLAEQARDFAKHLKRVVGKFRRKQAIIFGTNQIRENPGVRYGPKTYEPAGNALKLYSLMRFSATPRAVPEKWRSELNKKSGSFSMELSVEGDGRDEYDYKNIRIVKNKTAGTLWSDCWVRVWRKDRRRRGRGIDPAFDTLQFLTTIGLAIEGKQHRAEFTKSELHPLSGKTLTWEEFKTIIIAEEYQHPDMIERAGRIFKRHANGKVVGVRKLCFELIASGKATELFNDMVRAEKRQKRRDLEA